MIFGDELRGMEERNAGFRLHEQHTGEMGRIEPADLDELCPDWREREAFISGPAEMLDALDEHWDEHGDCDRLHMERFQPIIGEAEEGEGGTIRFRKSDCETESRRQPADPRGRRGGRPRAAVRLPRGHLPHLRRRAASRARCATCAPARSPASEGEMVRTCINAPEGPVEIEL